MKFISIGPKQYPCLFCSPLLWVVASMEINLYFKIAQAKNVFVWLFFMACPSKLYANDFFREKLWPDFENSKIQIECF